MRYAAGTDEQGRRIEVADPLVGRFESIARGEAGAEPGALVRGFLGLREVFGDDLPRQPRFVARVIEWLRRLIGQGARATVRESLAPERS